MKRKTEQRQDKILSLLNEKGEVSVEALSRLFDVSEVTIRKDLTDLENQERLMRKYGGATRIRSNNAENSFMEALSFYKKAIATTAVDLIEDHNRIIVDSGSTTAALIQQLSKCQDLIVMTNSLRVANALQEIASKPTLLMTGGTWDTRSDSFQGQVAESVLRSYDFDQLFIGADGIDLERGTTSFNELLGLSQVMSEVAREVIVMVEAEKIGRRIPNLELPWHRIDVLITDDRLTQEQQRKIESHQVQVIVAKSVYNE